MARLTMVLLVSGLNIAGLTSSIATGNPARRGLNRGSGGGVGRALDEGELGGWADA